MNKYIKQWQNNLIAGHFLAGKADGVFGPKTYEASKAQAKWLAIPAAGPIVIERIGDTQLIMDECARQGLSVAQTAYILATAYWETAKTMKPVVEAFWLSEDWRRKRLRYYPWHGRGYVQLTWKHNYKRASKELHHDFIANPDDALNSELAVKILVTGSMQGWFTGKKISDYINGSVVDFINARRVINGRDKARAIAAIALDYAEDLKAEGFGN